MATDTNLPMKNGNGDVEEYAIFKPARLPWDARIETAFKDLGVNKGTWKALCEAVFPSAKNVDTIILALSYCKSRKLDVFKRPVHIVPMWSAEAASDDDDGGKGGYIDTVWPSIAELRTTAHRTNQYAGCDRIEWGPAKTKSFTGRTKVWENKKRIWKEITKEVTFPEYAQLTVYRMVGGQRVAFHGPEVYWEEAYATIGKTELPNDMWTERSRGQLGKCCEAAALRMAFPEELGGMLTAEEMEGRRMTAAIDITPKDNGPPEPSAPPTRVESKPQPQLAFEDKKADTQAAKEPAAKAAAKPEKKAATKAKPAAEPEKQPDTEADTDEPEITDPDAYVDEFETKLFACEGDVEGMQEEWRTHQRYEQALPTEQRQRCYDLFKDACGEFPEFPE